MTGVYAIIPAGTICIGIGLAMGITAAIGTDATCVEAAGACEEMPRASASEFPINAPPAGAPASEFLINAEAAASGAAAATGVIIGGSAIAKTGSARLTPRRADLADLEADGVANTLPELPRTRVNSFASYRTLRYVPTYSRYRRYSAGTRTQQVSVYSNLRS